MAPTALDPRILRSPQAREIAKHLQEELKFYNEDDISRELIRLVEIESITPAAFGPWLGIAQSPNTVRAALVQNISVKIRELAIKKLGKLLSSTQWQEAWAALGGASGLLELLGNFSVKDVKQICRVLVRSANKVDVEPKRLRFTELFKALLLHLFLDGNSNLHENEDHRQLRTIYGRLISTCTKDTVSVLVTERWDEFKKHKNRLLVSHADTLQDLTVRYVFDNYPGGERWLVPLLTEYPSATTTTTGVSASMEFSLYLLQRLITENVKAPLSPKYFMTELVVPLLRRALKKKIDWSITQRIVVLTLMYIERHSKAVEALDLQNCHFVHLVGVCWSRKSDLFSNQFATVLSLAFTKVEKKQSLDALTRSGFLSVPISRRYALIQFYYRTVFNCDLNNEPDLKCIDLPPLTSTLLNSLLPPKDALVLFARMRSVKGDENLIDRNIYRYSNAHAETSVDIDMWHTVLLFRCGCRDQAGEVARKCFQARKQAAMASADQCQRAFNARSAVDYGMASGSLRLCLEAQEWARRFVRDSLTAKEIYQSTSNEGIILLSGVPEPLSERLSFPELRNGVEDANKIISFMFETTCLALREPSFNRHHFSGVLNLFGDVVRKRMEQAARLKRCVHITDEEVYHVLWIDTLKMLIEAEERGLSSGYENLSLQIVGGVLNYAHTVHVDLKDEEPATFRFFDELAKARDDLWQKHRISSHPASAALPKPFPRGLPIQHLIGPYVVYVRDAHMYTPYIASRMEATVFPDPRAALGPFPDDQEVREAVGTFVDDYTFALRMMLPQCLDKKEQKKRVDRAWSYAVGPLSEGRFTPEEAVRYWRASKWDNVFPKAWPRDEVIELLFPDWPLVPESHHTGEIEEWNPVPEAIYDIGVDNLHTIAYIDISKGLRNSSSHATVRTTLQLSVPVIPPVWHAGIFSRSRINQAKANPAIREGQVLSALLCVDSMLTKPQLLKTPFPSATESALIRFPAVYLDGELLLQNAPTTPETEDAFYCLEGHISSVPPSLLVQLAHNAYSSLVESSVKDSGHIKLERHALRLAKLLARCDRPALASRLVVRMVLDRPDNSSWHRQLLSRSFFSRLPASAAQECMSMFAKAIVTRIEKQAARSPDQAAEVTPDETTEVKQEQKYFVKITTVKLLAQLLGDTQCISEDFSLTLLSQLIIKASHIDIHRAVVDSLLIMLTGASTERTDKILTALETVIPIAGNLRERRPITGIEWSRAEDTLELPELDGLNSFGETAPMLSSLFSYLKSNPPAHHLSTNLVPFVSRIILPIITSLKHQTSRWTSLFLRKYGFNFTAQQDLFIPQLPREQQIMHDLLCWAIQCLPVSFIDEFVAYRTFNIAPPDSIAALNKRLKDDVATKSQHEVKSWLARYALGLAVSTPRFKITSLLGTKIHDAMPARTAGEMTKAVQAAYLKLYTVILLNDAETLYNVDREQRALWPFSPSKPIDKSWAKYYKPIMEAIIIYEESLRTREWERDPKRHPTVLPNTYSLRMHLLQYTAQHSEYPPDSEEHCAAFAARVTKIIDQITGGLYHNKFSELKASLKYVGGDNRLRVACQLGDISKTRLSWLTLQDHLRVELAASLLYEDTRNGGRKDELTERVEALRQSWRASESGEVRRTGYMYGIEWRA